MYGMIYPFILFDSSEWNNFFLTVFHYQVKVHVFGQKNFSVVEQPMLVSLYGTHGDQEGIPVTVYV